MAFHLYTVSKKYLAKVHCEINKNQKSMCKKDKNFFNCVL